MNSLIADLAEEMLNRGNVLHQIGLTFLLHFFCQEKKWNRNTQRQKKRTLERWNTNFHQCKKNTDVMWYIAQMMHLGAYYNRENSFDVLQHMLMYEVFVNYPVRQTTNQRA
jgi:hypothetical protein